jgi:dienelactone hydrolase
MRCLYLALAATALFAQDSRNTYIPNTDTHITMPVYKTRAEWEARKVHLRKQILSAAGLLPLPPKTPLNPQIFGRMEREGYAIEKVLIETMPGYYLGGNLYSPLGKPGKLPGILTAHGHWTYGRLEPSPLGSVPARCVNLARQGYVVFAYDMVGYNDTIQTPHEFGLTPVQNLWSFGPLGLQLWNSMRALDFLQSRDNVDPARIAMTGESGGGTQTFLLMAVDERVKWSVPVNMISAFFHGGSPCENTPGLRVGTFNLEIAAMMAPRPMLMISATGDWTRNTLREEYPAMQHMYELYDKAPEVEVIQVDAPHNYNAASREAMYRFFGKRIQNQTDATKLTDEKVNLEKINDMLALQGRALPANALDYDGVFAQWKRIALEQVAASDEAGQREHLMYAMGVEWPAQVSTEGEGQKLVLTRPGKGDRVPAIWIPGSGAPALVVNEKGAEAARRSPAVEAMLRAKRPVLLIDAFQTGSAIAPRDRSHVYFLTFNLSDDANRVQDILTALAFLNAKQPGKVELIGQGNAAVWSLFAAAVAPTELKLDADLAGFEGRDEDFIRRFFVPGVQHAGGLKTAVRLTERYR